MPFQVSVMSYNVRYDNPEETSHAWRRRRDDVASVIRFHGPDLIGLQEALHGQLDDLRDRLPSYEWLTAGRAEPECAGEYAAIGYDRDRFNLEADGTTWLSETPDEVGSCGWDGQLPRLVRHVRLREETTDVEFYHFNTHFDHYGETARVESAKLALERIDDLAANEPVVLTGDLNCLATSRPYELLTGREKRSSGRALRDTHRSARRGHHGPTTTVTDFRNLVPDRKIDYVLVSADVEPIVHGVCADTFGNGEYPSDHLPVLVDVSMPEYSTEPERSRGDETPEGEFPDREGGAPLDG